MNIKKIIKHNYTGLSIMELRDKFGVGSSGFFSSSLWYENYGFAKENPPKGIYEIIFDKGTNNKSLDEQIKELKKGYEVPHPAIVCEAILTHFKNTGERICEDWYVRTSSQVDAGGVSCVGYFNEGGLDVGSWYGGRDDVGVGASRRLSSSSKIVEALEDMKLDSAIKLLKDNGYKVIREY